MLNIISIYGFQVHSN